MTFQKLSYLGGGYQKVCSKGGITLKKGWGELPLFFTLRIKFNFSANLCCNVCKMHEDKKIETTNIQYNSLTQCTAEFLHWVMQVILKLFCLKLGSDDCFCCNYTVRSFCSIYAGERFCSKYEGDNFYWNYASGSLCCYHAGIIFYSPLCTWLFLL